MALNYPNSPHGKPEHAIPTNPRYKYELPALVVRKVMEALELCSAMLARRDESNAAIHISEVRYSPLTNEVKRSLDALKSAMRGNLIMKKNEDEELKDPAQRDWGKARLAEPLLRCPKSESHRPHGWTYRVDAHPMERGGSAHRYCPGIAEVPRDWRKEYLVQPPIRPKPWHQGYDIIAIHYKNHPLNAGMQIALRCRECSTMFDCFVAVRLSRHNANGDSELLQQEASGISCPNCRGPALPRGDS